jgi:uncharacterized protein YqgQ
MSVDFLGRHSQVLYEVSDLLVKWVFIILWGNRTLEIGHMALRFLDWVMHTLVSHDYSMDVHTVLVINIILDECLKNYEMY